MKTEVGTLTADNSDVTVILEDDTLNIRGICFEVSPNSTSVGEASTGFSDGTRNRSKSLLVTSTKRESKRSSTYAITHYKDVSGTTTRKIAGYITYISTPGEFTLHFDNYDTAYPIDYFVLGD